MTKPNVYMRYEDTAAYLDMQAALKAADTGGDVYADECVPRPIGCEAPPEATEERPVSRTMPRAIAELNARNVEYMCGGGNTHCGKTFGRIVQAWRDWNEYAALRAMYGRIAEQALDRGYVWLALWAVIEAEKYQEDSNDGTV